MTNETTLFSFPNGHVIECPICSSNNVDTKIEKEVFEYGTKKEGIVELTVNIPVRKCNECTFEFTDVDAEEIKHTAVCQHLRRMTPIEILGLRKSYGLTRKQFSEITLIGEASLARWETGELIQNAAYDQLLFLLKSKENMEHLRQRRATAGSKDNEKQVDAGNKKGKFRALSNIEEHVNQAKVFKLAFA